MAVRTAEHTETLLKVVAEVTPHLPKKADVDAAMRLHEKQCPHNLHARKALERGSFVDRLLRDTLTEQDILTVQNKTLEQRVEAAEKECNLLKRRLSDAEGAARAKRRASPGP